MICQLAVKDQLINHRICFIKMKYYLFNAAS